MFATMTRLPRSWQQRGAQAGRGERPPRRRWPASLIAGAVLLVIFAILAVAAPLFGNPAYINTLHGLTPTGLPVGVSSHYPLGTDLLGRNELTRLVYGIRVSLIVALLSNATSILIGAGVGLLAGFYRGPVEQFLMRMTDVGLALPYTLAGLVIAGVMTAGLLRVIVIITVLFWSYPARLVYGEVLRLRRRGFVEAADAMGARGSYTLARHLAPHILTLMLAYAPLNAASAVGFEATLSYLGAGVELGRASLGNMINDGQTAISYAPRLLLVPGIALVLLTMSFLLIGEGIKVFNPDLRRVSWLGQ